MKEERFLPIGTIVILKNGKRKVMITSYLIISGGKDKEKEQKMFDYGGCPYPAGIIESSYAVGFNHDQIETVVHMGHVDEEQKELNEILNKNYNDFHGLIKKPE